MNLVLSLSAHTGIRLAEVGFLLMLVAGVWLAAEEIPQLKLGGGWTVAPGLALAAGGLLLIIAVHWGHFG